MQGTSIFDQEWWYGAATDGKWDAVEYNDGQGVHAKLVFASRKQGGVKTIGMPPLARVMQPMINVSTLKDRTRLSHNIKAIKGLSAALPAHDQFNYTLPPESDLNLAYSLCGFNVTVSYTFRIDAGSDRCPSKEMDQKVRYNIKTGAKRLRVERHEDIGRYIKLSDAFLRHKAFDSRVDHDAISRIWSACQARNQATIMSCIDRAGNDIASAILLWDERHLYYWLNCRDPTSDDYAANTLLLWNAMTLAKEAGLSFDIDGYGTPEAGIFLSRFGLLPKPRFVVSRMNSSTRLKTALSSHLLETVGPKLRKKLLDTRNAVRFESAGLSRLGRDLLSRMSGNRDQVARGDKDAEHP